MKYFITSLLFFLSVAFGSTMAQQNTVTLLDKSMVKVDGTSNVHDWTAEAEQLYSNIDLNLSAFKSDPVQSPVNTFSLTVPVARMESGKGGMNRRMYDALKEDKHPNIIFELSSSEIVNVSSDSTFQLKASGTLNIAGVSRDISLPVEGSIQEDGTYKFTGSYKMNMTDYNVEPPSAMFGAIKAGETVTVTFELFFAKR